MTLVFLGDLSVVKHLVHASMAVYFPRKCLWSNTFYERTKWARKLLGNCIGINPLLEEETEQFHRQQQQTEYHWKKPFTDHFNYRPAQKPYHFSPNIILFRDYMLQNKAKSNLNKAAYRLKWIFVMHLHLSIPPSPRTAHSSKWTYMTLLYH